MQNIFAKNIYKKACIISFSVLVLIQQFNNTVMKTIAKLEDKLFALRTELKLTKDPETKASLEERIDFIQDDIDELEEAEYNDRAYQEMTGTTPQDLYNERNSYGIRQGEMIERFKNEY